MKFKPILIFITALILGTLRLAAQDVITLKNGTEVHARVIELNKSTVITRSEGQADSTFYDRAQVARIKYLSGVILQLSDDFPAAGPAGSVDTSMYMRGAADAGIYYKDYKTAATWSLVSGIIIPYGIITPIACSVTPPAMQNLGCPDPKLFSDRSYYEGYMKQAHRIKKKKVWTNYGIGAGSTLAIGILGIAAMIAATASY